MAGAGKRGAVERPMHSTKPLALSLLLWVADGVRREQSMRRWKSTHADLTTATPGREEYRQLHVAQDSPGLWPAIPGVETQIPPDTRVDGVAEVTYASLAAAWRGRGLAADAREDEVHNFRRSLLYAGPPHSTRWYDVAGSVDTRIWLYVLLRRRPGVSPRGLRDFMRHGLIDDLYGAGTLTELRTHVFLPWRRALWNSPRVAHDNPRDQRFHASISLGFGDRETLQEFLSGPVPEVLAVGLMSHAAAVHAYDATVHRFVSDGN
ncbi:EthD domain-containing protein [Aeromicrobium duanguangcaii]|uniref:EthD domain-containing protein n=1 Tax=Aeromicrobium duanguangcaii TaxID=2968086 RepID=A0ABY5KFY5_9ACTN|nr:EthD domain-containing protein [Aeromicrobium duanguangcaii]MCD9153525.1 EthD domain-containing protein [Aeromicrobium duanguangcaii]MCL3836490.1 EthD domain-containing protein [Aeromicrobium duanguangcaii]UUI69387.1 EthD domain-containing protein [Aeromicrobium duanguangcaii]